MLGMEVSDKNISILSVSWTYRFPFHRNIFREMSSTNEDVPSRPRDAKSQCRETWRHQICIKRWYGEVTVHMTADLSFSVSYDNHQRLYIEF